MTVQRIDALCLHLKPGRLSDRKLWFTEALAADGETLVCVLLCNACYIKNADGRRMKTRLTPGLTIETKEVHAS